MVRLPRLAVEFCALGVALIHMLQAVDQKGRDTQRELDFLAGKLPPAGGQLPSAPTRGLWGEPHQHLKLVPVRRATTPSRLLSTRGGDP